VSGLVVSYNYRLRAGLAAGWVFAVVSAPMTIYIKGTKFYLNHKASYQMVHPIADDW